MTPILLMTSRVGKPESIAIKYLRRQSLGEKFSRYSQKTFWLILTLILWAWQSYCGITAQRFLTPEFNLQYSEHSRNSISIGGIL